MHMVIYATRWATEGPTSYRLLRPLLRLLLSSTQTITLAAQIDNSIIDDPSHLQSLKTAAGPTIAGQALHGVQVTSIHSPRLLHLQKPHLPGAPQVHTRAHILHTGQQEHGSMHHPSHPCCMAYSCAAMAALISASSWGWGCCCNCCCCA